MYYICISPSFKDRKRSKAHSFSIFILPLLRSKLATISHLCQAPENALRCQVLWFSEKFAKCVKLWQPNMTEAVEILQRSIPVGDFLFWSAIMLEFIPHLMETCRLRQKSSTSQVPPQRPPIWAQWMMWWGGSWVHSAQDTHAFQDCQLEPSGASSCCHWRQLMMTLPQFALHHLQFQFERSTMTFLFTRLSFITTDHAKKIANTTTERF